MTIFVIIVTYNGLTNDWIAKSLDSIRNSNHHLQTVVVDNASTDETVSFIKKEYPEVVVFPQDRNLGFGQANNVGMRYALDREADYVFLLNQDAYLQPETISVLVQEHKNYPEYGVLSPIHLNGTASGIDRNFSYYVGIDKNSKFYFDAIQQQLSGVYEVPFVNAAAWLLPKNTLEVIGGFDPIFFHYGEDDNYCQRVLYHGLKIGVCAASYVLHDRVQVSGDRKLTREKQLLLKERQYKVQFANINVVKGEVILLNKIKALKKSLLKRSLVLQFKIVASLKEEISLLERVYVEVCSSRNINKEKAKHYLD